LKSNNYKKKDTRRRKIKTEATAEDNTGGGQGWTLQARQG